MRVEFKPGTNRVLLAMPYLMPALWPDGVLEIMNRFDADLKDLSKSEVDRVLEPDVFPVANAAAKHWRNAGWLVLKNA